MSLHVAAGLEKYVTGWFDGSSLEIQFWRSDKTQLRRPAEGI